ncbi:MAG TPA: S41 family peptidase [Prolixibacteraceae bacterium]|nr:S41 family peptidase [Prolixibacteraceae bacterium]
MSRYLKILLPLILALAIVLGIFLGSGIQQNVSRTNQRKTPLFQPDKLSVITRLIEQDYVDSIDKNELIEKIIPLILDELDPHTTYIKAEEMRAVSEEMRGNFSGIGVQFVMQNDTVMVIEVISGGPSQQVGILAGDRIVSVNEKAVSGVGLRSDSIVSLLKGKKGTLVNVGVSRPGFPDTLGFAITRGEIPIFSIDAAYMINKTTGLIKVNRFAESTYKEFHQSLVQLTETGMRKLIIDLRGNSGGYLQAVFSMVDEFLPKNQLIVYTEGKARPRFDYRSSGNGIWQEGSLVVLIDEYSASASEIFAGAIQDNDRGLIVGRRSFGKGLVQEQIPFIDGSALRLTVARFYTPSGRSIQKSYQDGNEAYRLDIYERRNNDELLERDSIHFADSLKYSTLGGRTVYGGGGIMPDVFIPVDTSGVNDFYIACVAQNILYTFCFDYADQHRSILSRFQKTDELKQYLTEQKVLDAFLVYAQTKGIRPTVQERRESERLLSTQISALIARNILGDNGFYPIVFEIDPTVQKAVELLKENWSAQSIVQFTEN